MATQLGVSGFQLDARNDNSVDYRAVCFGRLFFVINIKICVKGIDTYKNMCYNYIRRGGTPDEKLFFKGSNKGFVSGWLV